MLLVFTKGELENCVDGIVSIVRFKLKLVEIQHHFKRAHNANTKRCEYISTKRCALIATYSGKPESKQVASIVDFYAGIAHRFGLNLRQRIEIGFQIVGQHH